MFTLNKLTLPSLTWRHVALGTYILSITLLPIGFGGNRDFPFGLAQIGLALSSLILVFEQSILNESTWPKRIKLALALFGIVLVWGFLQTQNFMPAGWHHPLWQEASKVLHTPISGSIALWRGEAFFSLNRLITYITAGLLAYVLAADPVRARMMLQALWGSGIALCLYGYFNVLTGSIKVFWVDKIEYEHDLTSTFMSKNHFAIYAALVMLSGCALLYQSWRNALQSINPKQRLKGFMDWARDRAIVQFFLILFVFGAIILSHCRSGLVLGGAGIFAFFICVQIYAKEWKRAALLVAVALCCCALMLLIAGESSDYYARLFVDQSSNDRLSVYQLCLHAIADNPWLGYGLGSFHAVYRLYNQSITWSFNHAHSDILESLVDLGIPAGLLLWTAMALLISGLIHGLLKRHRHGLFPAVGMAASFIVICHSSIDFSLQIPGVAMPFAMLLGTGLAQSWGAHQKT